MEEDKDRWSEFREVSRKEMFEALEKAALSHEGCSYRFPLLDLCVTDEGIAVFPQECVGVIATPWESLLSIRYKPAEGDAPGTLTFSMPYAVVTIELEVNRHDG